MQLSFDAADRLVELVEARHGPVPAEDAARTLYSLRHVPAGLARYCSRTSSRGARLSMPRRPTSGSPTARHSAALESATYVVVDLETTGLSPGTSSICEIGAVRVRGPRARGEVRDARQPAPAAAGRDRGSDRDRPEATCAAHRRSSSPVRRFWSSPATRCSMSPQCPVRHRLSPPRSRTADRAGGSQAPVLYTVWLARRVLAGRNPARRARVAGALLRDGDAAVSPGACRRRGRRRRSCSR